MEIRVDIYYADCEQCKLHYLKDALLQPNSKHALGISQAHLDHLAKAHNVRQLVLTVEEGQGTQD